MTVHQIVKLGPQELALQTAVANLNATISALGPEARVSHWSNGGREWEFECRGSPEAFIAAMGHLGAALRANPARDVRLDRRSKRLFIQ